MSTALLGSFAISTAGRVEERAVPVGVAALIAIVGLERFVSVEFVALLFPIPLVVAMSPEVMGKRRGPMSAVPVVRGDGVASAVAVSLQRIRSAS